MILPAPSKPYLAPVIAMPVFDDHRRSIVDWVERIQEGGVRKVIPSITAVCHELRRVRNSTRHERLAEFLEHAVLAMRNDQPEGARCILLTALATFGWPSYLAG